MKFNEKLIELRKKAGLSQEELGYKLNVTRQTVSKWELGLTTPEMDKLTEMSKIFNVSVDELINDSETVSTNNTVIDDQPIGSKSESRRGSNIIITVIIFIVAAVILFFIIRMFFGVFVFNKFKDFAGGMFDGYNNTVSDMQDSFIQNAGDMIDGMMNIVENSEMGKSQFNDTFELNAGTGMGAKAIDVLDDIITSNKKEERKITVRYNEIETQNEEEIQNIKQNIDSFGNYDITFGYDEEGYINEVKIEKVISEMDIKVFNGSLEFWAGKRMSATTIDVLDDIITSNKTKERKITVKYNETETQNEEEINNIKRNIDKSGGDYNISFEYDENGFINKAIIEKF